MKVKIGPFLTWWGPYQISELLGHVGVSEEKHRKIGDYLAETWFNEVCQWVYDKRHRTVKIKIDRYDVWNMDGTLAIITLPMLKLLKEKKHGSCQVESEDVPQELRFECNGDYGPQKSFDFDGDCSEAYNNKSYEMIHARWEWVMNEMIWTFEQLQPDNDWEDQYWKVRPEIDFTDYPEDEEKVAVPIRWKVEGDCDYEGMKKHQERISNGTRLFGKYFQGLWD